MTLASGLLPYDYAHGKGPFLAPDPYQSSFPIGPSGILLEQAQFVITAERRKLLKTSIGGNNYLDDFFIYINSNIVPSGPYEPKANGSTLGNDIYPAAAFIIDHIHDTRIALNNFFGFISQDTNLSGPEYRAAWLQSLYPGNPSGFYSDFDEDAFGFTNIIGHWSHRMPSETGIIDYTSLEVLGASGVLYDVDIGEVLFNPAPHISTFGLDTMHSKLVNGQNDGFAIVQFPIFPAFQKTNGSIIPLTGREPSVIPQASDYHIDHINSGTIRLDGYTVFSNTMLALGRNGSIFNTTLDFTSFAEGQRSVLFGGNVAGSRLFSTPTSQPSGIYRIAAINKFASFPNTTIESGVMSFWPTSSSYWPNGLTSNGQVFGSTTTLDNLGYHVFDDCLWMTDVSFSDSTSLNTGFASGLAIMSPYTSHRLWVRYADQTAVPSTPLAGFPVVNKNWSTGKGLHRIAGNNIYRVHPNPQSDATIVSGQLIFIKYNDTLDFTTSTATTSDNVEPGTVNEFPLGNIVTINDFWYDDSTSEYWASNEINAGFDMWKFDSAFKYINKYIFNSPSGIFNARGFFMNSNHFLFDGLFGPIGDETIRGSGIYPVHIIAEGTAPYDSGGNTPEVGTAAVYPWEGKMINAAPFIGFRRFAQILDVVYVSSSTHLIPGVYALVIWSQETGTNRDLFLVRIEESTNTWEVHAISRLETGFILPAHPNRDLLHMSY